MTSTDRIETLMLLNLARQASRDGEGRRLREQCGLGLRETARQLGVGASSLRGWELGLRRPRGPWALAYGGLLLDLMVAIEKVGQA